MSAEQEEVVDPVMGGQEALCLAKRLEPRHLPLPPSRRLVRGLRPLVQPLVLSVLDRGHHSALSRSIARQLVGHHDTRRLALPFEQLAQQALGGLRVAAVLHEDVQHPPGLVHGTPQPVLHASDRQHGFIEVSFVSRTGQPAADLVRECPAGLQLSLAPVDPRCGSTVADDDAARG